MTVVFDTEALLAFAFDEPGTDVVEGWLDRVYDDEVRGCVTTVNLAEFRYVAARKTSMSRADGHIQDLLDIGLSEHGVDSLWRAVSTIKATYSPALGDAYAVAAASEIDGHESAETTLLVGADDDYDRFEATDEFGHLLERFRDDAA
jgi:predicted nucleic acid-binding protein